MTPIDVRFWDGKAEYDGHVRELAENRMVAQIRILDEARGTTTVPVDRIVASVVERLRGRILPVEMRKGDIQADILCKVESVERDAENPRRINVHATFENPGDAEKTAIAQLIQETRRRSRT